MGNDTDFNLYDYVNKWIDSINVEPTITESDAEELRSHLLDQIDDLKKTGLSDREAFWVASNRIHISEDIAMDYQETNNHLVQMQRSLLILGGVIVYFLFYNLIEFTSKGFYLSIIKFTDVNDYVALNWLVRYFIVWVFVVLIFLVSLYFMESITIKFINKIKLKPKHAIYLLLVTGLFELIDYLTLPYVKFSFKDKPYIQDRFIHYNFYFDIAFPVILSLGFIFIYYKYYKKTKFNIS